MEWPACFEGAIGTDREIIGKQQSGTPALCRVYLVVHALNMFRVSGRISSTALCARRFRVVPYFPYSVAESYCLHRSVYFAQSAEAQLLYKRICGSSRVTHSEMIDGGVVSLISLSALCYEPPFAILGCWITRSSNAFPSCELSGRGRPLCYSGAGVTSPRFEITIQTSLP